MIIADILKRSLTVCPYDVLARISRISYGISYVSGFNYGQGPIQFDCRRDQIIESNKSSPGPYA